MAVYRATDYDALAAEVEALRDRVKTLERMDREAANHVESVICMRTHFTGEPPYVGWEGLGLALREALDERDAGRATIAGLKAKVAAQRLQLRHMQIANLRYKAERLGAQRYATGAAHTIAALEARVEALTALLREAGSVGLAALQPETPRASVKGGPDA